MLEKQKETDYIAIKFSPHISVPLRMITISLSSQNFKLPSTLVYDLQAINIPIYYVGNTM